MSGRKRPYTFDEVKGRVTGLISVMEAVRDILGSHRPAQAALNLDDHIRKLKAAIEVEPTDPRFNLRILKKAAYIRNGIHYERASIHVEAWKLSELVKGSTNRCVGFNFPEVRDEGRAEKPQNVWVNGQTIPVCDVEVYDAPTVDLEMLTALCQACRRAGGTIYGFVRQELERQKGERPAPKGVKLVPPVPGVVPSPHISTRWMALRDLLRRRFPDGMMTMQDAKQAYYEVRVANGDRFLRSVKDISGQGIITPLCRMGAACNTRITKEGPPFTPTVEDRFHRIRWGYTSTSDSGVIRIPTATCPHPWMSDLP
jgi:hypothetical protein